MCLICWIFVHWRWRPWLGPWFGATSLRDSNTEIPPDISHWHFEALLHIFCLPTPIIHANTISGVVARRGTGQLLPTHKFQPVGKFSSSEENTKFGDENIPFWREIWGPSLNTEDPRPSMSEICRALSEDRNFLSPYFLNPRRRWTVQKWKYSSIEVQQCTQCTKNLKSKHYATMMLPNIGVAHAYEVTINSFPDNSPTIPWISVNSLDFSPTACKFPDSNNGHFPRQDLSPDNFLTSGQLPNFSLTAIKFPDISRVFRTSGHSGVRTSQASYPIPNINGSCWYQYPKHCIHLSTNTALAHPYYSY